MNSHCSLTQVDRLRHPNYQAVRKPNMKNLIPANTDISPSLDRHFEGKLSNNSVARVLTAFKSLLTDESPPKFSRSGDGVILLRRTVAE